MSKDLSLKLKVDTPFVKTTLARQSVTFSPVTDLAMSFSDLINDGFTGTPKTQINFDDSAEATPVVASKSLQPVVLNKELLQDTGSPCQSPSSLKDLPSHFIKRSFDLDKNTSSLEIRSAAFRRFKSLPRPFDELDDNSPVKSASLSPSSGSFSPCCRIGSAPTSPPGDGCRPSVGHQPSENCGGNSSVSSSNNNNCNSRFSLHDDEDSSQDSGLGLDKTQSPFAKPRAPAPRPLTSRARGVLSDNTNIINNNNNNGGGSVVSPTVQTSRRRSWTPDFTQHFRTNPLRESASPAKLRKSSLTCSPETDEGDDGFLDLSESDDDGDIPKGLEGLLRNPVLPSGSIERPTCHPLSRTSAFTPGLSVYNQETIRNKRAGSRRGLFRSPSTPARISDQCSPLHDRNRTDSDDANKDKNLYKKRKSISGHSENELNKADKLARCSSEAMIIWALDACDSDDFIGDFSKPYCLPTIVGSHCDLKCISPDTLAKVIEGHYNDIVERFTIIDCRYPYEFEGGHIKDAVNIWERSSMIEFHRSGRKSTTNRRNIIIFHCEFSSERAPKMSRFLREIDRAANKECYPSLGFPELYTLEGGYKAFYSKYKELCEPQTYKPMLHENHTQDLRHFRAKSKSWAGEKESKTSFRSYKLSSF